jgi:hypothetical protein
MNADFVIISYECNFWGFAALDALVDALETAGIDRDVYVVHNYKSTERIDYFKAHCRRASRPEAIKHVLAYEGVFEQVENWADFTCDHVHHFIAGHNYVLNWLIKYHLPEGRYFFIDHDCIARPGFVRALAGDFGAIEGKLFVFPRHDRNPQSLTGPLFYCDTEVRHHLGGLCDLAWSKNIVCGQREKLRGGVEVFYTDAEVERAIARNHFDDTLHNVVRYLLARWPALVDRVAALPWRECDHVWHGATRHLTRGQVDILKGLFATRFRPNYFLLDEGTDLFEDFLARLRECGLAREFTLRVLGRAPERSGVANPSLLGGVE